LRRSNDYLDFLERPETPGNMVYHCRGGCRDGAGSGDGDHVRRAGNGIVALREPRDEVPAVGQVDVMRTRKYCRMDDAVVLPLKRPGTVNDEFRRQVLESLRKMRRSGIERDPPDSRIGANVRRPMIRASAGSDDFNAGLPDKRPTDASSEIAEAPQHDNAHSQC